VVHQNQIEESMAILSSHFLNSVDGTHAGQVGVTLVHIADDATRKTVFETASDDGGRLSAEVDAITTSTYEMVIASGAYFQRQKLPQAGPQILHEIVIRFCMPDASARYHIPVIMGPHSYSCWWSS
jgi:5-hydroxyisourate hydrolase